MQRNHGLNGGRIWAENVKDWGAGFHLALPVHVPAAPVGRRKSCRN